TLDPQLDRSCRPRLKFEILHLNNGLYFWLKMHHWQNVTRQANLKKKLKLVILRNTTERV
ncbi:hypothetical protein D3X72_18525, partial [Acinetobacter baumannii]|uniref:hypothetical protein n=1 Tax=Acinetobacter baumannii TaxID=470 RepID=UPI000FEFADE5